AQLPESKSCFIILTVQRAILLGAPRNWQREFLLLWNERRNAPYAPARRAGSRT
ncbi:hypothetical protein A2U01_0084508, partial [Trifolium medium]|nr:hypothetical protein [Trifolium medium]